MLNGTLLVGVILGIAVCLLYVGIADWVAGEWRKQKLACAVVAQHREDERTEAERRFVDAHEAAARRASMHGPMPSANEIKPPWFQIAAPRNYGRN